MEVFKEFDNEGRSGTTLGSPGSALTMRARFGEFGEQRRPLKTNHSAILYGICTWRLRNSR